MRDGEECSTWNSYEGLHEGLSEGVEGGAGWVEEGGGDIVDVEIWGCWVEEIEEEIGGVSEVSDLQWGDEAVSAVSWA